jgi:hypothetical protein
MKIYNVEQGSPEWFAARAGVPTASEFNKIITPTGRASTQADKYANKLLADIIAGKPVNDFEATAYMDRGKELEAQAVSYYEFHTDTSTEIVGFITDDEGRYGCSPDRLIGDDGLLEIKCPAAHTHIDYALNGFDKDYYPQVQGQLLVTGRKWCDWMSYHPDLPPVIIRITRDSEYLFKMLAELATFRNLLDEKKQKLNSKGFA